jgi:nondiscriminating aspartyl-tRNA synthetase
MAIETSARILINSIPGHIGDTVLLRGWVYRLRVLASTTFIVLRDCTGEAQCVTHRERKELYGTPHQVIADQVHRSRLDNARSLRENYPRAHRDRGGEERGSRQELRLLVSDR